MPISYLDWRDWSTRKPQTQATTQTQQVSQPVTGTATYSGAATSDPYQAARDAATKQAQEANQRATEIQRQYWEKARQDYLDQMQKAMQAYQTGMSGATNYLTQSQNTQRPIQMAALSALQALPVLQQMAGLQGFAMPTSMQGIGTQAQSQPQTQAQIPNNPGVLYNQTTQMRNSVLAPRIGKTSYSGPYMPTGVDTNSLPVDSQGRPIDPQTGQVYAPMYGGAGPSVLSGSAPIDAWGRSPSAATASPSSNPIFSGGQGVATPGAGVNIGTGANATGGVSLTPTQVQYNPQASELYKFQQKQNTDALRKSLAARGLLTGGAGAQIENEMNRQLSAQEAQNQYNRVMDLVKIGMGAAETAGNWGNQLGSNLAGVQMQGASGMGGLYGGMGSTMMGWNQGMGGLLGQNEIAQAQLALQNAMLQNPNAQTQFISPITSGYGFGSGLPTGWGLF